MKIAINTLSVTEYRGGVKTYLLNTVQNLVKINDCNNYLLFVSPMNKRLFIGLDDKVKKITVPLRRDNPYLRVFFDQTFIRYLVRKHSIDLLFSPQNIVTFYPGCKQVLVVQGPFALSKLRQRYAPGQISQTKMLYYDLLFPISLKHADQIIAVSHNTKQWILKQVDIPPSKVIVVHEGVDLDFLANSADTGALDIDRPYILFLSTLYPYKNADKLIRAFAKLCYDYRVIYKLVIVGDDPGGQKELLLGLAEQLGVVDDVKLTGAIEHNRVSDIYHNADVFVYPSTVESFGLPVLEAMACGVPVVGSNRCSVPEIIGDAGLVVDPDDIEQLAEAVHQVLTDTELRENLIQKGYQRAQRFSWERSAKQTIRVFEKASQV